MYRWLLCWRYLRTRFIALASVISVTLGVATLIIVNAVMDGFVSEMQDRMHGILSDVIIESHTANGLPNHEMIQRRIQQLIGDEIEGITTVVHVPAMISIDHRGEPITRQINLIGIDTKTYAQVSDFSKYLLHPENQKQVSFELHESGYAPDHPNFQTLAGSIGVKWLPDEKESPSCRLKLNNSGARGTAFCSSRWRGWR
jgi:lipoprotein-releasing system permease protein